MQIYKVKGDMYLLLGRSKQQEREQWSEMTAMDVIYKKFISNIMKSFSNTNKHNIQEKKEIPK